MPSSWLSLLPPVIVMVSALISRKIHVSLLLGLMGALLIASHGSCFQALILGFTTLKNIITNTDTIFLYSFLTGLAILVAVFNATGATIAFAYAITQRIRSIVGLELASIGLSICMFADDYLSILAIGHMLSPIADHFKVARLKLAFLIHSFAGTVVILFPISSWAAVIIMYATQAGVTCSPNASNIAADPFFLYLWSLPFMFYSFLMIISVWLIIHFRLSFGPMRNHEHDQPVTIRPIATKPQATIWGLIIPLLTFINSTLIGLAYFGGHYSCGGTHTFIESIKYNQHPFLIMLIAVLLAIFSALIVGYDD